MPNKLQKKKNVPKVEKLKNINKRIKNKNYIFGISISIYKLNYVDWNALL